MSLDALEELIHQVGTLYPQGKKYWPIHDYCEKDLFPRAMTFGAQARKLMRAGFPDENEVESLCHELEKIVTAFHNAIARVKESPDYQEAIQAWQEGHQERLGSLIPQIFTHVMTVHQDATLYYPVTIRSHRSRGGGTLPFITPRACVDKLALLMAEGLRPAKEEPEMGGDAELRPIFFVDDPAQLDGPVALAVSTAGLPFRVFSLANEFLVYTPCLRAPFSVFLHKTASDEWWAAGGSYEGYRKEIEAELDTRSLSYCVS